MACQVNPKEALPPRVFALYEDLEKCGAIRVHKAWLRYETPYKQLSDTMLVKFKDVGGEWLEMTERFYSAALDHTGTP